MHYKSIVLELLMHQYPTLHENLRKRRDLLQALDRYSTDLKARHDAWKVQLAQTRPATSPTQIASEALEMAIEELRNHLSAESQTRSTSAEPLSLDEAIAYVRRHTPQD
jgi:hypothetical protein